MATLEQLENAIRVADAAGRKDDVLALAQEYRRLQAAGTPAPDAPTPAPTAPAAPGGPSAASAGGGGGPSPVAPSRPAPTPDPTDKRSPDYDPEKDPNNPANGDFSFSPFGIEALGTYNLPQGLGRYLAGAGQSVASNWRGLQQVGAKLTGDDESLKILNDQEAEARKLDAPLLNTTAGRAGQISGEIAQTMLPAGAASKASKLYKLGRLADTAVQTGVGVGLGAMSPTVNDDERTQNMITGGIAGGGLPALMNFGGGIKGAIARKLLSGGEDAARSSNMAGRLMGQAVKDSKVELNTGQLREIVGNYGDSWPQEIRDGLVKKLTQADQGIKLKGQTAQDMYSVLTKTAARADTSPMAAQGMNAAKRSIDQSLKEALPITKYRQLKVGRAASNVGTNPYNMLRPGAVMAPSIYAYLHQPPPPEENDNAP